MSPQTQLFALSAVLFVLVGVLVLVVLRLRSAWRTPAPSSHTRLSEDAFMATAMREALTARAAADTVHGGGAGAASAKRGADTSAAIELLPVAVLITDDGGIVRTANARARDLLGLAVPATGRSLRDTLGASPELREVVEQTQRTRMASGRTRLRLTPTSGAGAADREESGGRDRGPIVDVETMPIVRGSELAGVACVCTDVTALVHASERDQELFLERHLAMLASGLTHELANSLTALHGYARMIDSSGLSEIDRTSLHAVQEETSAISDTLDGFRRVVRPIEPVRDAFAVSALVEDAIGIVDREQPIAPGAVGQDVPADLQVIGDRVLLEEALAHVVRNAVEACREAGGPFMIQVTVRQDTERREVLVRVRDRGPGVPEVDRRRLFQPFFSTRPGRTGFGLAYARHVVLAHGGRLEADHPPDGGLLVTLTLPLAESATPAPPAR